MATTAINFYLSYDDETQYSYHLHRFRLEFRFNYRRQIVTRDYLGREITQSYRIGTPQSFVCSINAGLVVNQNQNSTVLLSNDLHRFLNVCNPDLEPQYRIDLAQTTVLSLKSTTIYPLRDATAHVEIVQQEHPWIPIPVYHHRQSTVDGGVWIMDGGDLVGEESGGGGGEIGSGASKLALNKLMKRRFCYPNGAGGDGEEECSICWEKYGEGVEAIKMPCDHVFHQRCILRWLNTKASCPLCRRTI